MFGFRQLEFIFECKLYKNFNKYYKKLNDKFYFFEIFKGFIGLNFSNL